MQKSRLKRRGFYIALFLGIFFLGGRLGKFGKESAFFQGFLIQKPIIRIGLGVNLTDFVIRSSSGMKVYEVKTNYKLVSNDAKEVHIRAHREKLTEKFLLQVAKTKGREEAEFIAQNLRTRVEKRISVEEDTENRLGSLFQVKVGDFFDRKEALEFIKKLDRIGIKEAWILREESPEDKGKPLTILVNDELKRLSPETVLYFVPSHEQSFLSFNGQNYRGIFVLRASPKGIVLINILNLEDYLKGVVPCELSPYNFGQLEAQKAQAVAARAYAIKNLGFYDDLGFDLLDTPKSQLYKGMSPEHPLSSKAVEETKGEVTLYNGELINALYSSSCGGKTENVENVFGGKSLPYLRSTRCFLEEQNEWVLKTSITLLPIQMEGKDVRLEIASLISLGIISPETNPSFFREKASFEEAVSWIKNSLLLLNKKNEKFSPENSALNFISLAELIISAFDWQDKLENLTLQEEIESLMKDFPALKPEQRKALACLVQAGIVPASKDIGKEERFLTRAELAFSIARVISNCRDFLHQGIFRGFNNNAFEVGEEYERRHFVLSPDVFLLRNMEGRHSFASQVSLFGGEEVRWLERDGEIRFLEIIYPSEKDVFSQTSRLFHWQARKSRQELEAEINQYYPLGQLKDIIIQQRGDSQRVRELLIVGAESQVVVSGLNIRWTLGLKDTLFDIDREYDEEGNVIYFNFSGKGWGHGVGLCQVGAFRMAQAGADYLGILKKYYQGIKISKIY